MTWFCGLRSWVALVATLCCWYGWEAPATAGFVLNVGYSGTVLSVQDTYGVFGSVAAGDLVTGTIGYSAPARPPDFGDSTFAEYHFPVTPGGNNQMTASVDGINLRATQTLIVQVYNIEDPNSPGDSIYGHSFQFIDGDLSLLKTSGLPSGYKLGYLGADVSLFATDPSLFDPPNPPSSLLPLAQYDSFYTDTDIDVAVFDGNGHFVTSAFIDIQITSLSSVPEPSSALLAGVAFPLVVAWARRRRTRQGM